MTDETTPPPIETGDPEELLELANTPEEQSEERASDIWWRIQMKLIASDPPGKEGRGMRMAHLHPARTDRTPEEAAEYERLMLEIAAEAIAERDRDGCSRAEAQLRAQLEASGERSTNAAIAELIANAEDRAASEADDQP